MAPHFISFQQLCWLRHCGLTRSAGSVGACSRRAVSRKLVHEAMNDKLRHVPRRARKTIMEAASILHVKMVHPGFSGGWWWSTGTVLVPRDRLDNADLRQLGLSLNNEHDSLEGASIAC